MLTDGLKPPVPLLLAFDTYGDRDASGFHPLGTVDLPYTGQVLTTAFIADLDAGIRQPARIRFAVFHTAKVYDNMYNVWSHY